MGISRRIGLAITGLAFAATTAVTLGAAGTASAQTATVTPQRSVTSYSIAPQHRRWRHWRKSLRSGNWTYFHYYKRTVWDWGCGCCC